MPHDPRQGPDFSRPNLSAGPPDLSGRGQSDAAPPVPAAPRATWSNFDKPITTRKPPLWVRIWPVALVLALVLVVGGAGYLLLNFNQLQRQSQVGSCLELSGSVSDVRMTTVDCGRPEFAWLVVAAGGSASDCAEEYSSVQSNYEDERGGSRAYAVLCLMPNFHQDACYTELADSEANGYRKVDCSAAEADFRIAAIHEKALDRLCEADTEAWTFPDPARTFCLGLPT